MTKNTIDNPGRRQFLRSSVLISAGALALGTLGTSIVGSAAPEKVSEDDQLAKSLNYHHDASQVDMAAHKDGQICSKCQFFQGESADEWGACQIFQGKLVSAKGWCSSFVAKS